MLASRAYGMRVVVEHAWKELGLDRALKQVQRQHDVAFPSERIVFAMALNRLVDPSSKRACNERALNGAWLPELEDSQVQHFYRSLDLLHKHTDKVLAAVGQAAREACDDDELTTLLIDTTSTYTESEYDDVERRHILDEWNAFWHGEADKPGGPRPRW